MTTLIKRHPFASFVILTYLISWPLFALVTVNPLFLIAGGFGPWAAALLISVQTGGRKNVHLMNRRVFNLSFSPVSFMLALVLPPIVYGVGYLFYLAGGGAPLDFSLAPPLFVYPVSLLFVMLLGGGQEEPGWRGFALPVLLRKRSPLSASLLLGLVWAFWHAPLFFSATAPQGGLPIGWYLLNTLAWSVTSTWFYLREKGLVFPIVLLHGGINAPSSWFFLDSSPGILSLYGGMALASLFLASGFIILTGWSRFSLPVLATDGLLSTQGNDLLIAPEAEPETEQ